VVHRNDTRKNKKNIFSNILKPMFKEGFVRLVRPSFLTANSIPPLRRSVVPLSFYSSSPSPLHISLDRENPGRILGTLQCCGGFHLLNDDISAAVELLLITAAGAAPPSAATPAVASVVFPLHDAMRAFQSRRKLHLRAPFALAPRRHPKLGAAAISELKRNETIRRSAFLGIIGGANTPLHPAFVVGSQNRFDLDSLSSFVSLDHFASSPLATSFMRSRVRMVPGIAANSTLHAQLLLMHESAAVALVVVVVGGNALHSVSPSGSSSIRFRQISMSFDCGTPLQDAEKGAQQKTEDHR